MDKNLVREEIIKSLMPTLNGMVTPDENLNLTKFIFYTTGSKIAANFTKNHEERFTELKEMIEKEEKLEKFVKVDQKTTVEQFVKDWLSKAEENRPRMEELNIDPAVALSELCRLSFHDKFIESDPGERKKMVEQFLTSLEE